MAKAENHKVGVQLEYGVETLASNHKDNLVHTVEAPMTKTVVDYLAAFDNNSKIVF